MGCKSYLSFLISGLLIVINLSCGGNLYEPMSNKTSHAAIIEEIKNLVNDLRFTEAITLIEGSTNLVITDRNEKMLMASAYAGACGLTFAEVFESLSTAAGSPMYFAMSAFTSKVVDPPKCYTAQLWIERIGAAGVRSTSENIAMFLIGFAKVGTYLRYRADTDATTGIGDGVVDAGYDSCDNTDMPRNEIKQVLTGIGLMIENIAALGTNLSGDMSGEITDIETSCASVGLTCEITDPTAISDADADFFRDAIKSDRTNEVGIENCDPLDISCCP